MYKKSLAALATVVLSPVLAAACVRPTMDERAVQWSSAIVEARLGSIGPEVKLGGEVQERRGPLGAMGVATTSYFYRVYQFDVSRSIDGPFKQGQKVPVIRLFSKTEEPATLGGGRCAQHLGPDGVGKEFVLMMRPLSESKAVVPNGVKPPDVTGAMCVIHLEPRESLKPGAMEEFANTIAGVRAAEQQFEPAQVDRLIGKIEVAPDDARAGPSVRALERMGIKVLPAVQQASMKSTSGAARTRLMQVLGDLTPPEPINMIEAVKAEPAQR